MWGKPPPRSNRPQTYSQTNGRFPLPPRAKANWRNRFGGEFWAYVLFISKQTQEFFWDY